MPRPSNPATYTRIEIPGAHLPDLEFLRRQARARSATASVVALVRWVTTNPTAMAEFGRWCDAQRDE